MQRIALDQIVFDAGTQIRAAIDAGLVTDYAEAMTGGAKFPPVVLFHDGNHHYLADGFHRLMAAQRLKFKDIDADIRPGTKDDALWHALGANKKNGKRLTTTDLQHAIRLAFQTWPDKSNHLIAEQIGCTDPWVAAQRREVQTALHLPDRVKGRDGKSYPATRQPKEPRPLLEPKGQRATQEANYHARIAAAVEGASPGVLKKFQRKSDGEIVTNAMQALDGIVGALQSVDTAAIADDPRADQWHTTVTVTLQVLRGFNRFLERKTA